MESILKPAPTFAFFVETCLEQQNSLQEIKGANTTLEEQLDARELCKLAKEKWENLNHEERKVYKNVKDKEKEYCSESKRMKMNIGISKACEGTTIENVKDDFVPKRAKSAYIFHLLEGGEKLEQENPNWELEALVKELERRWNAMEMKDKMKYHDMATEDMKRYNKEMEEYVIICREREMEDNLVDMEGSDKKDSAVLAKEGNEREMTLKAIEAKESNLIEFRETRKSVIQFTGSKQKVFKKDKYSPFYSLNDDAETSGNANRTENLSQKMDDKQVTHDSNSKEKMEHDWRVKKAHDIREKSVRDLAEKKKIMKQKALDAREKATIKLAEENELKDESEWNYCRYCLIEDCVLHSSSKMSEMIKFELNSIKDLENQSMTLVPEEGGRYSLTMRVPISQEAFVNLAASPMGQNLEELVIQPLQFMHHQCRPPDPYHVLRPETLSPYLKFPKLKKLLLEGLAMSKIHLISSNFPVLEDLYIGHLAQDYDDIPIHLDVSTLRTLHFRHFTVGEDFAPSLSRSPKLESFQSYKFAFGNATFILPSCRILSFCRSDCLKFLELFAPNLEKLNLMFCDVQKVDLLTQIPEKLRRARKFKWKVTGPEYEIESPLSSFVMNCGYGFPKELQKPKYWRSSIPNGSWKTSGRCTAVEEDWSHEFPNW